MGIFIGGRLCTCSAAKNVKARVSNVWNSTSLIVAKMQQKSDDVVTNVKGKVTNVWKCFTGRTAFESAEILYKKIEEKYCKEKKRFEYKFARLNHSIEVNIDYINSSKKQIQQGFARMKETLSHIKDIEIPQEFQVEVYNRENHHFEGIRNKEDLYHIDFNKNDFTIVLQGIFSLGMLTRKKARETLYAVLEEEKKLNFEISIMHESLARMRAINKSLENIKDYYAIMLGIYIRLLQRMDNNIVFLKFKCMRFAHAIMQERLTIRMLSQVQQKELEGLLTISKMLKTMNEQQMAVVDNLYGVKTYEGFIENVSENVQKTLSIIA